MLAGAIHETLACASPAVPVTAVGAPGTVRGVMAAEVADAAPVPAALMAETLNVYAVPLTRPVTVRVTPLLPVSATAVVHVVPSVDLSMRYPVTALPPLLAGAVQDRLTEAFPPVPETAVGTSGTVRGVTDTADDSVPLPAAFTARSLTWYVVPLTRSGIAIGLVVSSGLNAV